MLRTARRPETKYIICKYYFGRVAHVSTAATTKWRQSFYKFLNRLGTLYYYIVVVVLRRKEEVRRLSGRLANQAVRATEARKGTRAY